jgi:hypothetical protein
MMSPMPKIEAKSSIDEKIAGTIQPQIVLGAIESVCRNDSSLNPQKGLKTAVTIEAVKTQLK